MLLSHLLEGKMLQLDFRWGDTVVPLAVVRNPNASQVQVLYDGSNRGSGPYLRGLMYRYDALYLWKGFDATHDDIQHIIYPRLRHDHSDFVLLEIDHLGIKVTRWGDYDPARSKTFSAIQRGLIQSQFYQGKVPPEVL